MPSKRPTPSPFDLHDIGKRSYLNVKANERSGLLGLITGAAACKTLLRPLIEIVSGLSGRADAVPL